MYARNLVEKYFAEVYDLYTDTLEYVIWLVVSSPAIRVPYYTPTHILIKLMRFSYILENYSSAVFLFTGICLVI
jgi:hypothetical protein